jgi:hypothetical protein
MSTGDVLWMVLMGIILVWVADIFRLWEPWAEAVTRWWNSLRGRRNER